MPDRLILLPGGKAAFAEVKATGKTPRALQLKRHEQLRALGFMVFVVDGAEQITPLIAAVKGGGTEDAKA
jgi:ribose 5-phosphate isomerase